jgi:tRNA modification GTPase
MCEAGARLAQPGEFTLRAFLAGRLDLTQAEAVLGVIDATNRRQLDVALAQLAGGLATHFHAARQQLLSLCADVEAGLDFVDEDIQFISPQGIESQLQEILGILKATLQQMQARSESGHEPRIVLCGRPNAGKSTLWNRLLDHDTALVSPTPGTTRDYLEDHLDLGPLRCTLVDTAGMDQASSASAVEIAAQQMTRRSRQQASLVVLCLDGAQPLAPWELEELFTTTRRKFPRNLCVTEGFRAPVGCPGPLAVPPSINVADRPAVVVLTKIDDPQTADLTALLSSLPDWVEAEDRTEVVRLRLTTAAEEQSVELLKVSSHREVGLDRLREVLQHRLLEQGDVEAGVVASTATRCHESLRLSCEALVRARDLAVAQAGDELVAIEIRTALEELGKVVGTVYTEDILERIFSRFCIGK